MVGAVTAGGEMEGCAEDFKCACSECGWGVLWGVQEHCVSLLSLLLLTSHLLCHQVQRLHWFLSRCGLPSMIQTHTYHPRVYLSCHFWTVCPFTYILSLCFLPSELLATPTPTHFTSSIIPPPPHSNSNTPPLPQRPQYLLPCHHS